MAKYTKPYRLKKRTLPSGKIVWYYLIAGETTHLSTGQSVKYRAAQYVEEEVLPKLAMESEVTLRKYAEPFFEWDECPHIRRLRDENSRISKRHAHNQRIWLNKYILKDSIADLPFDCITRADIIDFRSRLVDQVGNNTLNKVIETLKVIFKEAIFREDLQRDPTVGVGIVKYKRKEAGTFTSMELADLFPTDPPGPWKDLKDYTCFLLAATIGASRGEILALRWRHVNLTEMAIRIEEAFKDLRGREIGDPKWGRSRTSPVPDVTAKALLNLKDDSLRIAQDDLIFCYDDGSRLGETWWQKRFVRAMEKIGIDRVGRNLKPHSFRHTLNTLLRDAKYDSAKIRAALGWTNERTQDIYTHWKVDHLREQANFVDELFTEKK